MNQPPNCGPIQRWIGASLARATAALSLLLALDTTASATPSPQATPKTDFVFVIDGTGSMGNKIDDVGDGLAGFVSGLSASQVDARFAIVLFGGEPELVLDFTNVIPDVVFAFNEIRTAGAAPGFHNNHNVNPEASLEAIRIVLGATNQPLDVTHVGGTGVLDYRADARKNLILVTDEDSDLPFHPDNQLPGQLATSPNGIDPPTACPGLDPAWQAEVDLTAEVVIAAGAYVNMLVLVADSPTACQLGNPDDDVSDPDLLNYDAMGTLDNLVASGFGDSLQAQVLEAGLIARSFHILNVSDSAFVDNFFAAKVQENNPFFFCPGEACPCGNEASGPVEGCANSTGDGGLLSASGSVSITADDLVLTMSQLPAGQWGALVLGDGSQACSQWGDGLRGVTPGPPGLFFTLDNANSGAAGRITSGPGIVNQAQTISGGPLAILAGTTWYFQGYYRDAAGGSPCGQRYNLTNALGVTFSN